MRLLAPAKINLHLRVGPRRTGGRGGGGGGGGGGDTAGDAGDGFHPLMSWMVTVGLFDTLILKRARGPAFVLKLDDDAAANVPSDGRNLVVRAASAFAQALAAAVANPAAEPGERRRAKVTGLSIVLHKRIPVGSGLGGGSSDGARTLLGLNWLWEAGWSLPKLASLGARLGSDLPFFLFGPSSICTGRGEIVRPIAAPAVARYALLVFPSFGVSTAAAYAQFDAMNAASTDVLAAEPDWERWRTLSARQLLPELANDLEGAAFALRPDLKSLHAELQRRLGRIVRMSGSGSTLFTLYDDPAEAAAAATALREQRAMVPAAAETAVVPLAPDIADDLSKSEPARQ